MYHSKFKDTIRVVNHSIPVLLEGPPGSGKTTLAKQIASELELPFYPISMTAQTTVSNLVGFKSVTGEYIPTNFRKCVEEGGVLLLDEIDASDPNTLLKLNTLDNGFMEFPDKIVETHKDFRLIATCNPIGDSQFTGRRKLDASTLDRYHNIYVDVDHDVILSMTDETHLEVFKEFNSYMEDELGEHYRITPRLLQRGFILGTLIESVHKDYKNGLINIFKKVTKNDSFTEESTVIIDSLDAVESIEDLIKWRDYELNK